MANSKPVPYTSYVYEINELNFLPDDYEDGKFFNIISHIKIYKFIVQNFSVLMLDVLAKKY